MPVMDEFKEEREALKHRTWKEKISYFFDYYKWHTAAAVAVAVFAFSIISQLLFSKDTAFFAALVNAVKLESADTYNQGFADYAGIDTADYDLIFDSSSHISANSLDQETMAASQKLMVYIASREIDVFLADEEVMRQYAYSDVFFDLREFLSEKQLASYSSYFYYIDRAVIEEIQAAPDAMDAEFTGYPDPRHPETMRSPVPVGIYLDNAAALKESYYFSGGDSVLGVMINTQRPETASQYIDYILQ